MRSFMPLLRTFVGLSSSGRPWHTLLFHSRHYIDKTESASLNKYERSGLMACSSNRYTKPPGSNSTYKTAPTYWPTPGAYKCKSWSKPHKRFLTEPASWTCMIGPKAHYSSWASQEQERQRFS